MNDLKLEVKLKGEPIQKEFEEQLLKEARAIAKRKLDVLFMDPVSVGPGSRYLLDRDLGAGLKIVNDVFVELVSDPKFEEHARGYIERNYPRFLEAALDEAMTHRARKQAFMTIGEQAPRLQQLEQEQHHAGTRR